MTRATMLTERAPVLAVDKGAERSAATAFSVDPLSTDDVSTYDAARAAPGAGEAANG